VVIVEEKGQFWGEFGAFQHCSMVANGKFDGWLCGSGFTGAVAAWVVSRVSHSARALGQCHWHSRWGWTCPKRKGQFLGLEIPIDFNGMGLRLEASVLL